MIPADIDPTLCASEPLDSLDDGFSPPVPGDDKPQDEPGKAGTGAEAALGHKSPF